MDNRDLDIIINSTITDIENYRRKIFLPSKWCLSK